MLDVIAGLVVGFACGALVILALWAAVGYDRARRVLAPEKVEAVAEARPGRFGYPEHYCRHIEGSQSHECDCKLGRDHAEQELA